MKGWLEALVEERDGGLDVLAPAVGFFGGAPRPGEVVVGGGRVGRLVVLGRPRELLLPEGPGGRVAERTLPNHRDPVAYGQRLLRLTPLCAEPSAAVAEVGRPSSARGLPDGTLAVTSPTHGMFYRRPRPDSPPYVEVGQVVEEGATLALVEVMKCFSAITYGGPGLPPRAEVVEVRAGDGVEVRADQLLFVVRPAAP